MIDYRPNRERYLAEERERIKTMGDAYHPTDRVLWLRDCAKLANDEADRQQAVNDRDGVPER